ncbi:MAG TPA: ATP-binding protein [Candidatus Ozemobacteraceae bacterium]|nr:ATP-binding protein [Candidatus Ozemobacteraceae bacterium]
MKPLGWLYRSPLQTQLRVLLLAAFIPGILILGVFTVIREHSIIRKNFQLKAEELVDLAAYNMAPGVEFEDLQALNEVVNGLTRRGEVAYVLVTDRTGRAMASYHPEQAAINSWKTDFSTTQIESRDDGHTLHQRHRLSFNQRFLGVLYMGFSLDQINAQLFLNHLVVAAVVLLTMIIITISARRIGRMITGPIESLKRLAEKFSQQNYSSPPVTIEAAQEIEFLAHTFNEMVKAIQERQNELRILNQTLEQKVTERTRQLEIETHKAQQSERLKSEFLSNMSHELRTPLTSILAWPDLILEHYERKQDVMTGAAQIKKTAQHLLRLINDLLDMEAIDTGRMRIEPVLTDITPLISEVMQYMQGYAISREVTIKTQLLSPLPPIVIDGDRLKQVLINLLSNAVKFSKKSGQVEFSASADDREISIRVVDHGVGIAEEDLKYIFDRFRQVDGSIRRRYGGSGVGLYLVKSLATIMGGTVEVASGLGEGSSFLATFPLPGAVGAKPVNSRPAEQPPDSPVSDANKGE